VALALSGLLFFLYPAVRPWHDESTVAGAVASMSSDAWVAAHLFAMLALILMPLGMLAVCVLAAGRRGAGLTLAATVIIWVGAGLTLPYYGAEDFALHAIAKQATSGAPLDLLSLVDSIRCCGSDHVHCRSAAARRRWDLDCRRDLAYGDLAAAQRGAPRDRAGPLCPAVLPAGMGPDCVRNAGRARLDLASRASPDRLRGAGGRPRQCRFGAVSLH